MENWVIQELKSLDIGDSRLDKRVKHILNSLSRSPEESIPVSCRTWSETKAAYSCFSNDKVSANTQTGVTRPTENTGKVITRWQRKSGFFDLSHNVFDNKAL